MRDEPAWMRVGLREEAESANNEEGKSVLTQPLSRKR